MFRTEINIPTSIKKISLQNPITLIGSCFSNNIGELLLRNKFNTLINPFGTIFNPISINKIISTSIHNGSLAQNGFEKQSDIHFHYDLHSSFSALNKEEVASKAKHAIDLTNKQIKANSWLIITWGTAIVYELKQSEQVVANCHKIPSKTFNKRMLTHDEIIANFEDLLTQLPDNINIILTVSPIRHVKDSLALNNVSKSTLRLATYSLAEKHDNVHYFPSYEIMMDDLRDYRFYKSDMLHPNEDAIQYIWDKFTATYFDQPTKDFIKKWAKIVAALNHRPFNPKSENHQLFLNQTVATLKELADKIDVDKELEHVNSQLLN